MKSWPTKKLGEISKIRMGETLIKKDLTGDGVPVYSADSLEKPWGFTSKNKLEFSRGAIIVGARGTLGSVKLPDDTLFTSTQTTIILSPQQKTVIPAFLFYYLRKVDFKKLRGGSGIPMLTVTRLNDLQIPFPPPSEQQKIVYVLDSIQDVIRAQEKIIEKTKELKKSLLNEIFNSEIKNQKWTKLGNMDYFEIKLGGTPKTNVAEYWNGKIYWITPNDLNKLHSQYISNTERKITQKGLNAGSTLLTAGSIILSTRAPIGYLAILNEDMAFNQGCKGIVIKKPNEVSNLYLFYYLSTQISKLKELGSGSTFRELSTSDLEQFSIPLANITQQHEIADILQTIDQKIEIERKKKALYEELFKTMLNKLMTGEIRVDNLKL